jgi:deoxyribodipyrimidine photo-lyase
VPRFLDATIRHFGFMLKGLREVEADLRAKHIPFHLLSGAAADNVPQFARDNHAAAVICDMSPLRVPMEWCREVASKLDADNIPLLQVCSA